MRYRVRHRTEYRYSEPALVSLNQVCLTPRDTAYQRVIEHRIAIQPPPNAQMSWSDSFGNVRRQCSFSEPHSTLIIDSEGVINVHPPARAPDDIGPSWEEAVRAVRDHKDAETLEAFQFVFESSYIRCAHEFRALTEPDFAPGTPLPAALAAFAARFKREFTYDAGSTDLSTTVNEVLRTRRGVCQDFTHLTISAFRSLGLAARYVSGYLRTIPPPGAPRLVGADASHCWVSVFAPGWGWIDVDPTNGCLVNDQHITIAWGRDYADVAPVKGVILGGGTQTIKVGVDVEPLEENVHASAEASA
jgi:transglutaminase-like putative cysteine protease